MSAMDIDDDVSTILSTLRIESDDELTGIYYVFEDLYERKLWFQLTEKLEEFYETPLSKGIRMRLFNQFIKKVASNINQLKYIEFLLASVEELSSNEEKLQFMKEVNDKLISEFPSEDKKYTFGLSKLYNQADDKVEAQLFLEIYIIKSQLQQKSDFEEDLIKIHKRIDVLNSNMNNLNIQKINCAYYSTCAEMYKLKQNYNEFYKNCLLYLSTLDLSKVDNNAKTNIAYDLSISALLGDNIYNFGELLLHEILNYLDTAEYSWLKELLKCMNFGNLQEFQVKFLPIIKTKNELLNSNIQFLKQKICLTALIESIFEKPNGKRILSFKEISDKTLTPIQEVEFLVMRALSIGLLKGFIDQISQTVTISWVQPRVMNREQIEQMRDKLSEWSSKVDHLSKFVETNGEGIWSEV